ncbi:MAG TPA: TonB-dependent receptor, partial [Chitinophagaceae bacterium]|nr:TonB-dependent receptor [Chitinophagaceae bacterium]
MKGILSFCILLFVCTNLYAQHTIKLSIKGGEEKSILVGATAAINSLNKSVLSDSTGLVLFNDIPAGSYAINISYIGFEEGIITVTVPQVGDAIQEVILEEAEEEEEEVIVTATRISRTINDLPTRVETISGEELTEKGNMKPGDIRMLLNESTGIQTQQTSATSYNSSIRIQGLDGRYTQILRDGFPLYAGFSGGLGLLQIAPLDLKQIEVIKGSSSTLYGGGAIAGLVNLVSKVPANERELSLLANATTAGGLDLSGFYSERFSKIGFTLFLSKNSSAAYDPADIGLTAIPKFNRYTINPKLFIYGTSTTATIGFSYITEERTGGSIDYIKRGAAGYFEKNNTDRFTTQFQLTHNLSERANLNLKNSYSRFNRLIQIPSYTFKGLQQTTFSEATYTNNRNSTNWVIGINFLTDDFKEEKQSTIVLRNYHFNTVGAFVQNTWDITNQLILETGLRGDFVTQYGFVLLPRFSAMYKASSKLTARLGGGFGYKTPSVFNEEAEKTQFKNILPIDQNSTINERSFGGNFDVNYRTQIGAMGVAINGLLFYTKLKRPLVLEGSGT